MKKQFHHVGIPTSLIRDEEIHLADAKLYVTPIDASPERIEWLRFEDGSPMPEKIQQEAHMAYLVDNVEEAMKGKELLVEPFVPMEGKVVGFTLEDGAPVEYMSISK